MTHPRRLVIVACVGLALVASAASAAGPYQDELSRCLVKSTTAEDKSVLVQWIFSMLALHPDVSRLASVSEGDRARLNKKAAELVERLLSDSCVAQAREAVKYDGMSAIEASFSVLGQVAAREIFANPAVESGMGEVGKNLDQKKLEKALKASP